MNLTRKKHLLRDHLFLDGGSFNNDTTTFNNDTTCILLVELSTLLNCPLTRAVTAKLVFDCQRAQTWKIAVLFILNGLFLCCSTVQVPTQSLTHTHNLQLSYAENDASVNCGKPKPALQHQTQDPGHVEYSIVAPGEHSIL